MTNPWVTRANLLALAVPMILAGGALASQYLGGLYPCEMCYWQRWPHYAALGLALVAFVTHGRLRVGLIGCAALAIMVSGAIGVYHAGVEYHWWAGPRCSAPARTLADILAMPLVRCDAPQWTLAGISMAGYNAILSTAGGLAVLILLMRGRPTASTQG